MKKVLSFRIGGDHYEISALPVNEEKGLACIADNFQDVCNTHDIYDVVDACEVKLNGTVTKKFGHNFAGRVLDAYDVFGDAVSGYVSDDNRFEWIYVHEDIKKSKEAIRSVLVERESYQVPKYVLDSRLEVLSLLAFSVKDGEVEFTWYHKYDTFLVLDAKTGEVITDMEFFAETAMSQAEENPDVKLIRIEE